MIFLKSSVSEGGRGGEKPPVNDLGSSIQRPAGTSATKRNVVPIASAFAAKRSHAAIDRLSYLHDFESSSLTAPLSPEFAVSSPRKMWVLSISHKQERDGGVVWHRVGRRSCQPSTNAGPEAISRAVAAVGVVPDGESGGKKEGEDQICDDSPVEEPSHPLLW